jgi:hypothetical protein
MRNIIPIIFVAATVLAGCCSTAPVNKTTAPGTNTVASANAMVATPAPAVVAPPVPAGPNTPAETLSENLRLGNLGAAFIVILTILAARSRP